MRREDQPILTGHAQYLLDLRCVAVGAHAVSLHVLVREAEMRALTASFPRTGHARYRIDDDGGPSIPIAPAQSRRGRERGRSGIAACTAY